MDENILPDGPGRPAGPMGPMKKDEPVIYDSNCYFIHNCELVMALNYTK